MALYLVWADNANAACRVEEVQGQEAVERWECIDGRTCTTYSIFVATLAFGGMFWDMARLQWLLSRMKKVFQTWPGCMMLLNNRIRASKGTLTLSVFGGRSRTFPAAIFSGE